MGTCRDPEAEQRLEIGARLLVQPHAGRDVGVEPVDADVGQQLHEQSWSQSKQCGCPLRQWIPKR